jgi:hypothetical protein
MINLQKGGWREAKSVAAPGADAAMQQGKLSRPAALCQGFLLQRTNLFVVSL